MTKEIKMNYLSREYLGSDGMPLSKHYNLYLQKCRDFKNKAIKYKLDNLSLKKSILPKDRLGYEPNEDFEREILERRNVELETFKKNYDVVQLFEDSDQMYESSKGKSKRIRIVRQLKSHGEKEQFSEDFEKRNECWFTRYWTLSKFIQAARQVIIRNRLLKNLKLLKLLTPKRVAKLLKNEGVDVQLFTQLPEKDLSDDSEKEEEPKAKITPCGQFQLPCGRCPPKKKTEVTLTEN